MLCYVRLCGYVTRENRENNFIMKLFKSNFEPKKVEQFLITENKFISDLFSVASIPVRQDYAQDDNESDEINRAFKIQNKKTSRAKSLQELQLRLEAITNNKKLTYKEKLTKKGLKNRMKKKSKQDERNAKQKLARAAKLTKPKIEMETQDEANDEHKIIKPVFNSRDKMVFSKINFENLGKKINKKQEKDPKKLLKQLEYQKVKLEKLKESGEVEKVAQIKEKTAWKNALSKAEGIKVKDDPLLLKKSVKKKEQQQRSHKKKWEKRIQGVQKAKEEKQQKRAQNIEKRKKDKKNKKLKTASKRGRIIPGF
ncbi:hypothetical protein NQ315_012179 [Exocentrus adspersus]|uniref:Ribosomal RNA-processing protein 14/surfeit locus protein 6 C-terminal domain-containing protein n=1 Tax=Exocentrus adspersus TaxID=1586481 RepID=A0AAV8VZ75_9CUCU|nr:hypothetical protein NQ315_012179 [Exocentrus adspersus]